MGCTMCTRAWGNKVAWAWTMEYDPIKYHLNKYPQLTIVNHQGTHESAYHLIQVNVPNQTNNSTVLSVTHLIIHLKSVLKDHQILYIKQISIKTGSNYSDGQSHKL